MSTCLIEEQLLRAEASAGSKDELTSLLALFKIIVSNLLDNDVDSKYKTISKESSYTSSQLLRLPEVKNLFLLLGYQEEANQFVYNSSDENMIKLQSCLVILEDRIKHQEGATFGQKTESSSSQRVKNLLLSRQIKKEQSNDMKVMIKSEKRPLSRSSDFSFNPNGSFHQSSNSNEKRRNRSFIKDLFHQQDHADIKGWSSSGVHHKLI
jgi:hypothetical protein